MSIPGQTHGVQTARCGPGGGNLYRLMPPDERERLHRAIACAMRGVTREIVDRQLAHFEKVDSAYAAGIRQALEE